MQTRFGLALGAAGVWTMPAVAPASNRVAHLLGMQTHLEDRRGIALTFDDGPHPEGTPAVLDMLARLGAPAAFFLTGEQVSGTQMWHARSPRWVTPLACMDIATVS